MSKKLYYLVITSLMYACVSSAISAECDTSIQPAFLPGLETNTPVLALDHFYYNNTAHIIGAELWRAVHIWQNHNNSSNNTWELNESLSTGAAGTVVMKLLTFDDPARSLLVVGGSQTNLTNGIFAVWERDKESWAYNSEVVLPYEIVVAYTNAFVSGDSHNITIIAQGLKGDGLQFFTQNNSDWKQTDLIVNDAPVVTFTDANNNLFLASIESKGQTVRDLHYFINIWQQHGQAWEFVVQISVGKHYVCELAYTLINNLPTLIAGTEAGALVMWQQDKQGRWPLIEEIQAHKERISGLKIVEYLDKKYLVSGSWDGTIKIWQVNQDLWQPVKTLCTKEFTGGRVESMDSFLDEQSNLIIAAGCAEGQVTCTALWSINSAELV